MASVARAALLLAILSACSLQQVFCQAAARPCTATLKQWGMQPAKVGCDMYDISALLDCRAKWGSSQR